MIDRYLDPVTHDLVITDDIQLVEGRLEVLQAVKCSILTIRGEWTFDISIGVPWWGSEGAMFDIITRREERESYVKNAIMVVEEVQQIDMFEMTADNEHRGGAIKYRAKTAHGPISTSEAG